MTLQSPGLGSYRAAVILVGWLAASSPAAEIMPPGQQNALVEKYCAVCHTDAANNGGLSLEHFDAAQAAPSLMAMLLSKLSGGVPLALAAQAGANGEAAALVNERVRSGAMRAAGIPIPDDATIDRWIGAFTVESAGATEWTLEVTKAGPAQRRLTASILREAPSVKDVSQAESYRLIASCDGITGQGYLQLAWSPVAQSGSLAASVDGNAASRYRVEGSEKMGNGNGAVLHGLAALILAESRPGTPNTGLPFPAKSLTIRDLFPGETVTFSFAELPEEARHEFEACFPRAQGTIALR